ncbi:MAG TPA: VWA domain-containing protein [Vicinamibacterales bacterium]|jgi:VWFA-related protein
MRTPAFVRSILALILASLVCAAMQVASSASQRPVSRERSLFVSAVDNNGEPVQGLGPEAFVVREDGVRREVLRVSRATEPIDVAVLIDNSQSASEEITFFREALSKFVAKMAPGNHIALIGLAERPTILVDYTDDTKRLSDAVGRLFPMSGSGMTLLDAMFETSKGLGKRETPRAVMVPVFTDGVEFSNHYHRDVVDALRKAQTALHMVTIGQFPHSEEPEGTRERSLLLDLAPRESGGQRITLLSPHGLDPALQRLSRELLSQYKVTYGRPESLIPPEKTEVSSGKAGVTVRGAPARGESGA